MLSFLILILDMFSTFHFFNNFHLWFRVSCFCLWILSVLILCSCPAFQRVNYAYMGCQNIKFLTKVAGYNVIVLFFLIDNFHWFILRASKHYRFLCLWYFTKCLLLHCKIKATNYFWCISMHWNWFIILSWSSGCLFTSMRGIIVISKLINYGGHLRFWAFPYSHR